MPSAVRVTLLCVFFLVFLNDHLFQFRGTRRRRSWGVVTATTMARFDDLSHIFPSQLETSHMRSHLFYPFGGSSQDHEQGRQQTYHMFRQRHTRSNVFQKRPPFCFNKISRRRFTEFFFFLNSRNAFLWGRSRATKSGRTGNCLLVNTFKTISLTALIWSVLADRSKASRSLPLA